MKMPSLQKTILISIVLHAGLGALLFGLISPARSLLTPGELQSSVEVLTANPSRPTSNPSAPAHSQINTQTRSKAAPGSAPSSASASTIGSTIGSTIDPTAGSSTPASSGTIASAYLVDVQTRIRAQTTYPLSVRRRGISGKIEIRVVIAPNGTIARIDSLSSGAASELHILAEDAAKKAAPFAPTPTQQEMSLVVPFEFRLN